MRGHPREDREHGVDRDHEEEDHRGTENTETHRDEAACRGHRARASRGGRSRDATKLAALEFVRLLVLRRRATSHWPAKGRPRWTRGEPLRSSRTRLCRALPE